MKGNIHKAIEKEQAKLIKKANEKGLYENFGQKEVRKLEEVWINQSSFTEEMNERRRAIVGFNNWCMDYTP